MPRKKLVVAALGAALFAAAGIARAVIPDSSGVFTACMHKSTGKIRLIDKSLSASSHLSHCTSPETEISWSKQGAPGTDGVSPTVAQLGAGDPNCPTGGASMTDAAGHVAYVCNGTDFAGTFTSPNGLFSVAVTDTGITLRGPGGQVKLDGTSAEIRGTTNLALKAGASAILEGGAVTDVKGALVQLNGCARRVAGIGELVIVSPSTGSGQVLGPGFPTVCAG